MKIPIPSLLIIGLTAILITGCKGTLGTETLNVSGSVLSGGTLVGGSLTVASNTVSLGGRYSQGTNTYTGGVSVQQ